MLTEFLNSIKGELGSQLTGKTDLSPDKIGDVGNVVSDTMKSGILDKFKDGGLDDIVGLLGKGGSSSSFAGSLVEQTVGNLASKVGLPTGLASTVAKIAVPFIIDKLGSFAASKGKNNNEGVQDLLGDLVGGSLKEGLLGGLGKKFGL